MMSTSSPPAQPGPPRLPRLLLRWLVREPHAESVLAETDASYRADVDGRGRFFAYWAYWREALSMGTLALRREARPSSATRPGAPDFVMRTLVGDVRYAMRSLRRAPGFAVLAVVTLALGVGANSAIFSVVRGILLRPLPYPDADRLVALWNTNLDDGDVHTVSGPNFVSWTELADVFSHLYASSDGTVTVAWKDGREQLEAGEVTSDFFSTLGIRPIVGRGFRASDDGLGAPRVTVIGHGYWRRRFGGDPDVVGQTLQIDGAQYEIVGVAPAGVEMPLRGEKDLWYTLDPDLLSWPRDIYHLRVVARLADGVSLEQARQRIHAQWDGIRAKYPDVTKAGVRLIALKEQIVGDTRSALLIIQGAVGFVLLMACVNVANLLLARGTTREPEIAVRRALGASRGRLVRQLLAESTVLAGLAAILGILLAKLGVDLLIRLAPESLPRASEVSVDAAVLGFTLLAAGEAHGAELRIASEGYFDALRIPTLQGRRLARSDTRQHARVIVVSELLADELWPGESPIGKRLSLLTGTRDDAPIWREVVGVVGDVRLEGLDDIKRGMLYIPYTQAPQYSMMIALRTSSAPETVAETVRQTIQEVEPLAPTPRITTMEERVAETLSERRFYMLLLATFAAVAVLLASVGLYGVLSYMVNSRTGEIGVRVALGANGARILRLVVRQGMAISLVGVAIGVAGALATSRVLAGLLFGITPADPVTFAAIVLLLSLISFAACYIPAIRATRIDPLEALRIDG